MESSTPPPVSFAEPRDWQDVMKNRSRYKMHELIEKLGLRAKWSSNKRGKTQFDSNAVKSLITDMGRVTDALPQDADELLAYLAKPNSLSDEVDALVEKHGPAIWGRDVNRDHLVHASDPTVHDMYPKDLYYEDERDREQIRALLHWWTGIKACNRLLARERTGRDRKKKQERLRLRDEDGTARELSAVFPIVSSGGVLIAPAGRSETVPLSYTASARHAQALRLDTTYSNPASPMSGTPLHSNDSPVVAGYGVGSDSFYTFPARDVNGPPRQGRTLSPPLAHHLGHETTVRPHRSTPPISRPPSLHQLRAEIGSLVSNFLEDDNNPRAGQDAALASRDGEAQQRSDGQGQALDAETLQAFRVYITTHEVGPGWDQAVLLRRLERAWRDKIRARQKGPEGANAALFAAQDGAFLTWIELKRHIADLIEAGKRWEAEDDQQDPQAMQDDEAARIARDNEHRNLRAASRDVVRTWDDLNRRFAADWPGERVSADDVLQQAFQTLAGDSTLAASSVGDTVEWLRQQLEQSADDEGQGDEGLLYVRT
ncbi:uncharacterized protein EI97DRAFT_31616 [Westerdykella ornata]|uniref:Uncharacterized protein n=1 Tax=Westerdykella ornata TaxID=318751 RepID=A0A6A6JYN2_WESOR|nr:uncharacterized protein EI97DRAFT_31616 [Westerdykella ornata]KAF2281517.1 hypothetical protein EI97DRAFT_31616 [Westerdykella ornata]